MRLWKLVVVLAVVGGLFAAAFGAAAALTINETELAGGDAEVTDCGGEVDVAYDVHWNATAERYSVDAVVLSGLIECATGTVQVTLTDADGAALVSGTATVSVTGTASVDTSATDPDPADVMDIHIVVQM